MKTFDKVRYVGSALIGILMFCLGYPIMNKNGIDITNLIIIIIISAIYNMLITLLEKIYDKINSK